MKTELSSLTRPGINTDRISVASKQRVQKNEAPADSGAPPVQASSAFLREVPMQKNAEFVEIDGKKYFLDAPRGSYVNILV